jgi:hypothetical protein
MSGRTPTPTGGGRPHLMPRVGRLCGFDGDGWLVLPREARVEPRRRFIQTPARSVRNLDV